MSSAQFCSWRKFVLESKFYWIFIFINTVCLNMCVWVMSFIKQILGQITLSLLHFPCPFIEYQFSVYKQVCFWSFYGSHWSIYSSEHQNLLGWLHIYKSTKRPGRQRVKNLLTVSYFVSYFGYSSSLKSNVHFEINLSTLKTYVRILRAIIMFRQINMKTLTSLHILSVI